MPDAASHVPTLMRTSESFRRSWAQQSDSSLDGRIRAAVAIAPPPPVRGFDPDTVAAIKIPITLITGEADTEAPCTEFASWLARQNSGFRSYSIGPDVGHYTFLGFPNGAVDGDDAALFRDNVDVNRAQVHKRVTEEELLAFA